MTKLLVGGLLAVLATGVIASPAVGASVCASSAVGIDTSLAHGSGSTIINSVGQTFATADTLMTSLTVWAIGDNSYHSVSAVLVATDAAGTPTGPPLWQGDPLTVLEPGTKTLTWTMDPPLVLPHAGRYAWFVCSVLVDLMAVQGPDVYPEGRMWDTCRGDCGPSQGCAFPIDADFAFHVTFCVDAPTGARRHTWGRLKSFYR